MHSNFADAKFLHQSWRSTTIRTLLSLQQIPVQFLADSSRRDDIIAKSQSLTEAIKKITKAVEMDMGRYMLPPVKAKSQQQRKKLFDVVSKAVILVLNCQLSSEKPHFNMPKGGEEVNPVWMDCVGSFADEGAEGRGAALKVLIPVSAAIVKVSPADGKQECVAKANVFPQVVRKEGKRS
jgi:hypothetical protein